MSSASFLDEMKEQLAELEKRLSCAEEVSGELWKKSEQSINHKLSIVASPNFARTSIQTNFELRVTNSDLQ